MADFGDPLTSSLPPPAGQSFHLSHEVAQHLLYGVAQNIVPLCHVSNMMNNNFVDSLTSHLPSGQNFNLSSTSVVE